MRQGRWWRGLAVLGPGLLAALADNDAGGVISYVVTGAKFGYGLFLPLLCGMLFLTYTVQEMAMRLGICTGAGFSALVRQRYGRFWMGYQLISLLAENVLTLMTEFMGMSAGLMVLGLPMWGSVLVGAALVLALTLVRGSRARERIALGVALGNGVFLVLALWMRPDWGAVGQSFLPWHWAAADGKGMLWYAVAMVGNAVAPWMLFYQNSAYAEKTAQTSLLRRGRIDTFVGSLCQLLIAVGLLLIGVLLQGAVAEPETAGPAQLILAIQSRFGGILPLLFGLGLFNAGLLAAMTVSLSSAWSVAQALGWSKKQTDTIKEAPGFYGIYGGSVLLSAGLVLLPKLPLNEMAVLTQVLSGVLMVPVLFFLLRLTSDPALMGAFCNTRGQKIRGWLSAGILTMGAIGAVLVPFL